MLMLGFEIELLERMETYEIEEKNGAALEIPGVQQSLLEYVKRMSLLEKVQPEYLKICGGAK